MTLTMGTGATTLSTYELHVGAHAHRRRRLSGDDVYFAIFAGHLARRVGGLVGPLPRWRGDVTDIVRGTSRPAPTSSWSASVTSTTRATTTAAASRATTLRSPLRAPRRSDGASTPAAAVALALAGLAGGLALFL